MTTEEVKEIMAMPEMDEAVMVGTVEDRENYFPAIVGYDKEKGRFKYDFDLLCHCFAEEFRKADEESVDPEPGRDYETDGVEWVEYNVIRSLPYWGEHAPEIVYPEEDE